MSYLDGAEDWERFWSEHREGLLGRREPLTFEGHGLGLTAHGGEIIGRPNVYPYFQRSRRGPWLAGVLGGEVRTRAGCETVAQALRSRGLQLRCEPGRSLLDGCGAHRGASGVSQAAARRHLAHRPRHEPNAVPVDLRRLPRRSPALARTGAPRGAGSRAISSARTASSASS